MCRKEKVPGPGCVANWRETTHAGGPVTGGGVSRRGLRRQVASTFPYFPHTLRIGPVVDLKEATRKGKSQRGAVEQDISMGDESNGGSSYELPWQFSDRVVTEHLGSQKYSTSTRAIRELVANSLDAGATCVRIHLQENAIGGLESVTVSDNGSGISPEVLRERFVKVGVEPVGEGVAARLGRFGVGRLAVHRIGTLSTWESLSCLKNGQRVRIAFTLTSTPSPLLVREEAVAEAEPCGTTVVIRNIRDKGGEGLTPGGIANDLVAHFCSYLLANPTRRIFVQDEMLDVQSMVKSRESEIIPPSSLVPQPAHLDHILLARSVEQSRFPAQIVFSGKGRTVATADMDTPPAPNYLGLVECPYLDSIVTSNREVLIEMDQGFAELRESAKVRIRAFGERFRTANKTMFIQKARQLPYYPYAGVTSDPVLAAKQAIYDVVLEKVNEAANIERMTNRQQQVVFCLLRRSLENENVLEVLHEVAKLSDADMEKFRKLLERTTLDSILKLSSEVTHRLDFLDILHKLVYGELAGRVKERTQLHKILEPDCWIFGSQFHLAASDRSFREIIRRHRIKAGLDDVSEEAIASIKGVDDIPDLFLASSRDYPAHPKHHHLLVEIKAPSVPLGRKERDQIRRYAETILDSDEFDKTSTRWDLFLVSGRATKEIERDRTQKDAPHGRLYSWENMDVWAFEWCEIENRAREEMQLVRDHLKRKSEELTISGYLQENFPEILVTLSQQLGEPALLPGGELQPAEHAQAAIAS